MKRIIKFHLAQINPIVGAFQGNVQKIIDFYDRLKKTSDCVIFPEMSVVGYPPQDLLFLDQFVEMNLKGVNQVASRTGSVPAVVGFVDRRDHKLYNAAGILVNGQVRHVVHKSLLPTYDVFDESRYFSPALTREPVKMKLGNHEVRLGIHICEDLWDAGYDIKVVDELAGEGADIFINISASPYYSKKILERVALAKRKCIQFGKPFIYCNLVGAQEQLVFDGYSFVLDASGQPIALAKAFEEDILSVNLHLDEVSSAKTTFPEIRREEEIFRALVLGLRDYCLKAGFNSVVIGMSGGIDSSLTAVIATEAVGVDNVYGISMPSLYTSEISQSDAKQLAGNLDIHYLIIPIENTFRHYQEMLSEPFREKHPDVTEENIQARIRGNILMAFSNKCGHLVLSTGNKTELALGYCTLYGDTTGGLAVISDVSKMEVYALAQWYNEVKGKEIIPRSILKKKPSAELRADQVDPFDYNVVSPLVDEIIEHHKTMKSLVEMGYKGELVKEIMDRINQAEYKRRQVAPGLKITRKAFGVGRRVPIINHFRETV